MKKFLIRLSGAISLSLMPVAVFADKPPTAPAATPAENTQPWLYAGSDIPVDRSWTFGTLDNGLRYAVKRNNVPAGQISVRVRIDAGALYERDDEQGFAHFIEHLAFRGSSNIAEGEAKRLWQRLGVTFGSDSNAQTTATQTVYKLDLPAATSQALDQSMRILADMMQAPRIDAASVDAERQIILAELREGDNAQSRFGDALRAHFFQEQKISKRTAIGTPETLQAADIAGLTAFHKRWYRPENAVIVMAGDVEPEYLEAAIRDHFSGWAGQGAPASEPDFGQPVRTPELARIFVDPTLRNEVTIAYLRPWEKVDDTIAFNEGLLTDALAVQIINRRLENAARRGGSFLFAAVAREDFARSSDLTAVTIDPAGDDWEKAVRDVRAIIADAMTTAPSQADIDREVQLFANALNVNRDSYAFEAASVQADSIVQAVDIRETVATPDTVVQVFEGMRNRLTPDRLLQSSQHIFTAPVERIIFATRKDEPGLQTRLSLALTDNIAAQAGARLSEDGLDFDQLPELGPAGNLVDSETFERFEVEKLRFSNGVQAILSPNKAENGQVRLAVRFGHGMKSIPPGSAGLAWAGELVLSENGIGKFTSADIDQMVNGRRIELNFRLGEDAFEFSATTPGADLADQLKLIATKLEYPGWDPAPVERARAFSIQNYDGFDMSALTILQRDLEYYLSDKDDRWKIPDRDGISDLTPEAFRAFWEPLLKSGDIEIAIFGDFDRDAAISALESSFGAMAPRPPAKIADGAGERHFPVGQPSVRLVHKGPEDQAAAIIAWPTGGGFSDIASARHLDILAAIFADRLFDKFRSEQAASYNPDARNYWPESFDDGGYFMVYSQIRPGDIDKFMNVVNEIAADLATNPVGQDELQRAIEPIRQNIERASTGNTFWLNLLKGMATEPRRMTVLGTLLSDYISTGAETVMQLARKYLRDDRAFRLTVLPDMAGR